MDRITIVSETERVNKEVEKFFAFCDSFTTGEGISAYLEKGITGRELGKIQHNIRAMFRTTYDRNKAFMYMYVKMFKNLNTELHFSDIYINVKFAEAAKLCRVHDGEFSFIDSLKKFYEENEKTELLMDFDQFVLEMYKVKMILGKNKRKRWPKAILEFFDWDKTLVPESRIKHKHITTLDVAV